jgi:hypothetical protein
MKTLTNSASAFRNLQIRRPAVQQRFQELKSIYPNADENTLRARAKSEITSVRSKPSE